MPFLLYYENIPNSIMAIFFHKLAFVHNILSKEGVELLIIHLHTGYVLSKKR